jgi:hypothetical protein
MVQWLGTAFLTYSKSAKLSAGLQNNVIGVLICFTGKATGGTEDFGER